MSQLVLAPLLLGLARPNLHTTTTTLLQPTTPTEQLLQLRGGADNLLSTATLANTLAALMLLSGATAYISPTGNIAKYAPTAVADDASCAFMRINAALQVVAGATIIAAQHSLDAAVATSFTGLAIALLAATPGFEKLGMPKEPLAVWVFAMAALGKLAREGTISSDLALKISVGIGAVTSTQELLYPKLTFDAYKMPPPSAVAKIIFDNFVWLKLGLAGFLFAIYKTGKLEMGLVALSATTVTAIVKFLATGQSAAAGIKTEGMAFWAILMSAIGGLAYTNAA